MNSPHATFGQEFYPYDSIRALRLAEKAKDADRRGLLEQISATLPHASVNTRHRVAGKIAQRYLGPDSGPFVRLVARQKQTPVQIELLFWQVCQTDTLVGALARELFHPVCVAGRVPEGFDAATFAARNGAQLFGGDDVTPQITRAFLRDYARERWNFTQLSTLDRALRILQAAGLVAQVRLTDLRGHPRAYRLCHHDVSPLTFVWALYDEFLPSAQQSGGAMLAPGVLAVSDCARTLLLSPAQVTAHCEAARRRGFLSGQGDVLRLTFGNLDALADALLSRAI